jgi:hypothetical protein
MGSQKPIIGSGKPDVVAVILERSVAQQLALALAWALGSTSGGKTESKGGGVSVAFKGAAPGMKLGSTDVGKKLGATDAGKKLGSTDVGKKTKAADVGKKTKTGSVSKKTGGKKPGGKK